MGKLGVPIELINITKILFVGASSSIMANGNITREFAIE
jgi:hypothetical protein